MDSGAWRAAVHRVAELDMTEWLTHTHKVLYQSWDEITFRLHLSKNISCLLLKIICRALRLNSSALSYMLMALGLNLSITFMVYLWSPCKSDFSKVRFYITVHICRLKNFTRCGNISWFSIAFPEKKMHCTFLSLQPLWLSFYKFIFLDMGKVFSSSIGL